MAFVEEADITITTESIREINKQHKRGSLSLELSSIYVHSIPWENRRNRDNWD